MELEIHVIHYLVISTIMMFCGIYGFFTRKNLLALLISVELMLNATNINFAVFNRYLFPDHLEGHRYRHSSSRNRCSHRHHYQCIPECQTDTD